ncbi:MAG: RNA methyltransferase [Hyphomicrobiales bacterium]|nr:MAG: RNA methyltransferase [Hyphomicrobiales bacterium]
MFEHISSTSNDTVKLLKALDRKKERQETGLFLAEGEHFAEEALGNGWKPAYVFADVAAADRPRTRDLLERMRGAGARVLTAADKVLAAISGKDNPQGIVAAFHQRLTPLRDLPVTGKRRYVALYEVRDPGNLGTIIRTADAAGCDGVILIGSTCDPFSVDAVRATMGSLFAMRLASVPFAAFRDWCGAGKVRIVAASMRGDHPHHEATYGERSCILMGNEQSGLPDAVEDQCDELVRIPMMGRAESLNLGIATGLMVYEAWRAQGFGRQAT